MIDKAIVIDIRPHVASNYTAWPLEPVLGKPVIERFFERANSGFPVGELEFWVLSSTAHLQPLLKIVFQNTSFVKLFFSNDAGRLDLYSQFLNIHAHLKTLLIFPEETLFQDCRLSYSLYQHHRRSKAEATKAPDYPPGLLPEIYQASALQRLSNMGLTSDMSQDFFQVMEKTNTLFPADDTLKFKLAKPSAQKLEKDPVLHTLPADLLIDDVRAFQAGENVLSQHSKTIDSTDAQRFKTEWLSISHSRGFSFSIAPPPPGKIPILFNTKYGAFTGGQECFFDLIAHIDKNRYYAMVSLTYDGVLAEKLRNAGIPVELGRFDMDPLTPWSLNYFGALLSWTHAQVIHVDGTPATPLVVAAQEARVPFVYHLREFLGRQAPPLMQFADVIITGSKAVTRDIQRSSIDPERIVHIYESLRLDAFRPEQYIKAELRTEAGIGKEQKVATMITRIDPQKKVDLMIQALPALIKKFPEILFLIVGEVYPKDAEYRTRLQTMITESKLQNHVRFWGFEKDIAKIHALSDILVSCCPTEPFGHSILEALAMRLPVIAANRGGHTEILNHNVNSLLFDAQDSHSLATELIHFFSDPHLGPRLADKGYETIQKLDIHEHARQVATVYDRILNK